MTPFKPRGRKRIHPVRVRLPRFSTPFTTDVVIWRDVSPSERSGSVRVNLSCTCLQHVSSGYACGMGAGIGASDLALNILNAFRPPRPVPVRRWTDEQRDDDPLKTFKGVASRFAIEHHQEFKRELIETLPADGGRIDASRIREWIAMRQRPA